LQIDFKYERFEEQTRGFARQLIYVLIIDYLIRSEKQLFSATPFSYFRFTA
jgi:hypothetical protein